MSEPPSPNNTLQQGNEWLKPVDPNEGERKWAQYAAASTPPRRSGATSLTATPHSGGSHSGLIERGAPPVPIAMEAPPTSRPGKTGTPPLTPSSNVIPGKEVPQLYAQIDGKLVPVTVGIDGTIVPIRHRPRSSSPPFDFDSDCDESKARGSAIQHPPIAQSPMQMPQSSWTPTQAITFPSAVEQQNAWLLLQQQQQLLFQLQQQQAITTAALAGIAARTQSSPDTWPGAGPPHANAGHEFSSDNSSAFVTHSDCGLSGQGSATVTPTTEVKAPRASRQEALLNQLRNTTITLPPPPPPPAPEKPFTNTKRKSKLEALMNSLQYTDLLTPSYSGKAQTQSETGVVVEAPDDDEIASMVSTGSNFTTPSNFSPGYKKKACRAYFSSTGCRHGEKCLFSHASPADES